MSEDNQLEPKELWFLIECCVMNSRGVDLNNFDELWDNLEDKTKFKNRNHCSAYKKKLGEKKWIKGKRNVFMLPKSLDILADGNQFLVWHSGERKRVPTLKFKVEFEYDSGEDKQEPR